MMQKIKELWVAILGGIIIILDLGFDVVNPILIELVDNFGLSHLWISILKVIFGLYGIYRLYKAKPKTEKKESVVLIAKDSDNTNDQPVAPIVGTRPGDR